MGEQTKDDLTQEEVKFVLRNRDFIRTLITSFFVRVDKIEVHEGKITSWHITEASSKNKDKEDRTK